jgi:hypothetical protein
MASAPAFGSTELFTHMIGEIAKAVSERSGETAQQQFARSQAAVHMILGLMPRDVIELLLAGHCVILHEAMLAGAHDTLLGEPEAMRHRTRSGVIALSKQFNSNLVHLARYQARPAAGQREASETQPTGLTAGATPAPARSRAEPAPSAAPPPTRLRPVAQETADGLAEHESKAEMAHQPSPAALADCQANPEAMAALAAGDPERFATALGIAIPAHGFLEAANMPGSPFDPNATGPWPNSAISARRTG